MKKLLLQLLLTFNITSIPFLQAIQPLTPENTVFAFDLDDVVIKKSASHKLKLVAGGIAHDPRNGYRYIKALINVKNQYKKYKDSGEDSDKETLYDEHGNKVMGLTFHFLYHGMRIKELVPYVAWIVNTMEHSLSFIPETRNIILHLKKKGYSIVFATNKDRVSYDLTAKALGTELTQLVSKVFVAQPGNKQETLDDIMRFAQEKDIPESYRALANQALTIQPTKKIIHAPSRKPNPEYFECLADSLGSNKNIIFIDDKKSNVTGFNNLQQTSNATMHGIHFINPTQLADELVKIGILSEDKDQDFLEEVRNPGLINKAKRYFNKLFKKHKSLVMNS